jgi:hypothetical protein
MSTFTFHIYWSRLADHNSVTCYTIDLNWNSNKNNAYIYYKDLQTFKSLKIFENSLKQSWKVK